MSVPHFELPDEILRLILVCLTWEEKTRLRLNKQIVRVTEEDELWLNKRNVLREYWEIYRFYIEPDLASELKRTRNGLYADWLATTDGRFIAGPGQHGQPYNLLGIKEAFAQLREWEIGFFNDRKWGHDLRPIELRNPIRATLVGFALSDELPNEWRARMNERTAEEREGIRAYLNRSGGVHARVLASLVSSLPLSEPTKKLRTEL